MTTLPTTHTPIHELPPLALTMAHGYTRGDELRMHAVLRVRFEGATLGDVSAATGIPTSTLSDLCRGFTRLVENWNTRHALDEPHDPAEAQTADAQTAGAGAA